MNRRSSVNIARSRTRSLVTCDRVNCTPQAYERIRQELYQLLAKYMEFTEDDFDVEITRTRMIIHIAGEKD